MNSHNPEDINLQWIEAFRRLRYEEMERLLKLGADVNVRDGWGHPALVHAVAPAGGCLRTVKMLVQAGADIHFHDQSGRSLIDIGFASVSSALENQRMAEIAAYLRTQGAE